jgi:hypothetical protein
MAAPTPPPTDASRSMVPNLKLLCVLPQTTTAYFVHHRAAGFAIEAVLASRARPHALANGYNKVGNIENLSGTRHWLRLGA